MPLIHYLNLSYYNCPVPQIETKKALDSIGYGDLLQVTVTNPICYNAILELVRYLGYTVLSNIKNGNSFVITIRK